MLVDGIYPQWSIFIQLVHETQGKCSQHFAKAKEVTCKDVEHILHHKISKLFPSNSKPTLQSINAFVETKYNDNANAIELLDHKIEKQ
jgi:hypothetical protein